MLKEVILPIVCTQDMPSLTLLGCSEAGQGFNNEKGGNIHPRSQREHQRRLYLDVI